MNFALVETTSQIVEIEQLMEYKLFRDGVCAEMFDFRKSQRL